MRIPERINNIIQRIIESEKEWKALYMASWGCVLHWLEPEFKIKHPDLWEKPLRFGLPASKKGYQEYIPAELCGILKSKDMEFTLGHLQTLFSLLEELVNELCPLVCDEQEIRADRFGNLKKFLSGDKPYNKFKIDITENDFKELELAKETRNCFIHNNSKIDDKWLKAYKKARGEKVAVKIGDELLAHVYFHQIEDWRELIIRIVNEIKDAIIKL